MKKTFVAIACGIMCFIGYNMVTNAPQSTIDVTMPHGTLSAATLPKGAFSGLESLQIPEDILRDQAKKLVSIKDTVVIHDTIAVNNTKYIRVPAPDSTTDTIYVPLHMPNEVEGVSVKNRSPGQAKKSVVVLSVDGQVVYDSDEP